MRYFLDCEFNGYRGQLISIALVSEDGLREIYLVEDPAVRDWPIEWVANNVIPILECPGAKPNVCRVSNFDLYIEEFLEGDPSPVIVADWPDDIRYFCQCLIVGPGEMVKTPQRIQFEVNRVDAYPSDLPGAVQHNALWDARALRAKLSVTNGVRRMNGELE